MVDANPPEAGVPSDIHRHWLMPYALCSKYTTELTFKLFLRLCLSLAAQNNKSKMDLADPQIFWYWIEHWIIARWMTPFSARSLVWIQTYGFYKIMLIQSVVVVYFKLTPMLKMEINRQSLVKTLWHFKQNTFIL